MDAEIAKFDRIAAQWWDPHGPMRPLHEMQPGRMAYVLDQFGAAGIGAPPSVEPEPRRRLAGSRLVDLGCGAGLMTEPLARLGAETVGLDLSEGALAAARAHAAAGGLAIDYRLQRAEDLAARVVAGDEPPFDAALALEVVEHLDDRPSFLSAAARCVRPGGLVVLSTLNRTARSFVGAVVAAEYLLRWLPPGTHDWRRFVSPETLSGECAEAGLRPVDRAGFVYAPLSRSWTRSETDLSINYALTTVRDA